jgi:hypothetical protein
MTFLLLRSCNGLPPRVRDCGVCGSYLLILKKVRIKDEVPQLD